MVKIENLVKEYSGRRVIDIKNLNVNDGEILAVAGANGSGKTTLLRITSGLMKADSGFVEAQGKILFMPQQSYAFRGSLKDNLLIGLNGKDKKGEVEEILESMELKHLSDKKAVSLSGGELQRLALCRLLIRPCSLLLLDEPTSSCDARGTELVVDAVKKYVEKHGCTVIMVTHSPIVAAKCADRMIILNDGGIEADGEPGEVMNAPSSEWAKSFIKDWRT